MKNQKGVTLIALIVTIIVLLILAMTSVSLVLRTNLIKTSQQARNEYIEAADQENQELTNYENEVNTIWNDLTSTSN